MQRREAVGVAKARAAFFCSDCGYESTRWLGRCPGCASWNTFVEAPAQKAPAARAARTAAPAAAPVRLAEIDVERAARISTGIAEFDAVLGGGVVPGSLVLIGGPPGAGKSTLLLQVAQGLAKTIAPLVYVSGEESAAQTKLRAQRLGVADDVLVFAETDLRAILDDLEQRRPKLLIVDSIQTVFLPAVESAPGSVGQIRECAQALLEFSKRTDCATFIVGHITKEGAIAGPRLLEHLVDTVLYFEGEQGGEFRIIRAYKNRFGSAEEICVFEMGEQGLREIANPSMLFLSGRAQRPSGSCVVPSLVGSRPILVEVQALVGEAAYGTPRRLAANLDAARLAMILAVLERRLGMALGSHDVYASVAGGLRVNEPAADLGIALAIASAFRGVPLASDAAAFGEIGLAGEVRAVGQGARRAGEARKLGFTTVYAPPEIPDVAAAIRAALG
jgi:DNA repair protein RadA/Sms